MTHCLPERSQAESVLILPVTTPIIALCHLSFGGKVNSTTPIIHRASTKLTAMTKTLLGPLFATPPLIKSILLLYTDPSRFTAPCPAIHHRSIRTYGRKHTEVDRYPSERDIGRIWLHKQAHNIAESALSGSGEVLGL